MPRLRPKFIIREGTDKEQYAYNEQELYKIEKRWLNEGRTGVVYKLDRLFGISPFPEVEDGTK